MNTIHGGAALNREFREFIQSLNDNRVEYLVVGGYALGFHGYPRYTKDIDIWIKISPVNARNALSAIEQFGFGSLELKEEHFLVERQIIQIGYPPLRIDILSSLDGVDFDECYAAREGIEIEGTSIYFIGLKHLIQNKKATGRLQDMADVENLE